MISVRLNFLIYGSAKDYPNLWLQLSDFIFPHVGMKESLNHLLVLFLIMLSLSLLTGAKSSLKTFYRPIEGAKDQVNMQLLLICSLLMR